MKSLLRWISGIRFAILLIGITALFVMTGTFIESYTESHLNAAYFTYHSPFFFILLAGFFLNILLSALSRWPFQTKHIPFLVTHLGLLLMISGIAIKNLIGVQGSMAILEGTSNQRLFLQNTHALKITKRDPQQLQGIVSQEFSLHLDGSHPLKARAFDELEVKLVNHVPHSVERLELWIKGSHAFIEGIKPFAVFEWNHIENLSQIPMSATLQLFPSENPWNLFAVRSPSISNLAERLYLQGLIVRLTKTDSQELITELSLEKLLQDKTVFPEGEAHATLAFNYSSVLGFNEPILSIVYTYQHSKGIIEIPLQGQDSLLNHNISSPYFGSAPLQVDLIKEPSIAFLQDLQGDDFLFIYDSFGRVHSEIFRADNLHSLYIVDEGYGGYAVQSAYAFLPYQFNREERELADLHHLSTQFKNALASSSLLAPPLELLFQACQKANQDFVSTCLGFLYEWDRSSSWLYPKDKILPDTLSSVMQKLDWNQVPEEVKKSCLLSSLIFSDIEPEMKKGGDLLALLQKRKWPFVKALEKTRMLTGPCRPQEIGDLLSILQKQIDQVSRQIPEIKAESSVEIAQNQAHLLSAYLRSYGIHLRSLQSPAEGEEIQERLYAFLKGKLALLETQENSSLTTIQKLKSALQAPAVKLEAPVSLLHRNLIPSNKWEDNVAKITLQLKDRQDTQLITLAFDRFGSGLQWPAMNGKYLLQFQPQSQVLPYSIHLRDARQINYPNSNQPYSYESDLVIRDAKNGEVVEKTLSMNHVHETWDGYRFYLANISPPLETAAQRIQLIVNYDPVKYWLTYSGALFVSLGIFLLFWMRPYPKRK